MTDKLELCPKCKSSLKKGKAIVNKSTGIPDFYDDDTIITVSPDSKRFILADNIYKCRGCGHSIAYETPHGFYYATV